MLRSRLQEMVKVVGRDDLASGDVAVRTEANRFDARLVQADGRDTEAGGLDSRSAQFFEQAAFDENGQRRPGRDRQDRGAQEECSCVGSQPSTGAREQHAESDAPSHFLADASLSRTASWLQS